MSESLPNAPYAASFFDHYFDWVDRLPIPVWLYYGLLYIASVILVELPFWVAGALPWARVDLAGLVGGIWVPLESGTMHYLDHLGARQIEKLRSSLGLDPDSYSVLRYRIQTMPQRPVLLLTGLLLVGVLTVAILSPGTFAPEGASAAVGWLGAVSFFFGYITSPGYIFHIFHQLRVVRKAYEQVEDINLFNLGPLHSLSVVTAQTGMAIFLLLALNYANNIALAGGEVSLLPAVIFPSVGITLVILVFLLPLLDIRGRIQEKKEDLLKQNGEVLQDSMQELQKRMARRELNEVPELQDGINALVLVGKQLENISPWPWNPDTLRSFLSAILLPIFLFIVQQVLSRFL